MRCHSVNCSTLVWVMEFLGSGREGLLSAHLNGVGNSASSSSAQGKDMGKLGRASICHPFWCHQYLSGSVSGKVLFDLQVTFDYSGERHTLKLRNRSV